MNDTQLKRVKRRLKKEKTAQKMSYNEIARPIGKTGNAVRNAMDEDDPGDMTLGTFVGICGQLGLDPGQVLK